MQEKRKLIEVAVPLDAINQGSIEDKNRKTGHIRNLHKWFAPMPLPAWRSMLFAALVDYPGDGDDTQTASERERLLKIAERLAHYDSYTDRELLQQAREEISRSLGTTPVTVVDPFCGGGSTIVEAQRLGLSSIAADLNPLPVLITTVLCRIPALFAGQRPVHEDAAKSLIGWTGTEGLKSDIRAYAAIVRERAWRQLAPYYPHHDGATPVAYRWAWAVRSPDPSAKGALTPLVADWWLSKRKGSKAFVAPKVTTSGVTYSVEINGEVPKGTTGRNGARCLFGGTAIPLDYIRAEGRAGRLQPTLIAVATRKERLTEFLSPSDDEIGIASSCPEPDFDGIDMPPAALGFRVQQYGIGNFAGLFTRRQRLSLSVFADEVRAIHGDICGRARDCGLLDDDVPLERGGSGARAYADAVTTVLGLCVGKLAQSNNILVRWFIDPRNGSGKATPSFDRHAIPMVWDFVETNPFGGSVGDWTGPVLETALRAFELCATDGPPARVIQSDARTINEHISAPALIATDPPYYANIGYADLSDFFYQWLRRALRPIYPALLGTVATPKENELIASSTRHGGDQEEANKYFRVGFQSVFAGLSKVTDSRFPIIIVYALKQSEDDQDGSLSTGWEVFLGGLFDAGLKIVATWPVRTTTLTRMIGLGTNALASAIFVIARPRSDNAQTIRRGEFLRELRDALPIAYKRLVALNIAPVDLAQAAIGPGIEIYSKYKGVVETDGSSMTVGAALRLINQVLDEALVHSDAEFDPETRWALAWCEQFAFDEGEYGIAETLSKAKVTSVEGLADEEIVVSKAGKVRLRRPNELSPDWDPLSDTRLTVWKTVHQLIRVLESGGESAAALVVPKLGARAEVARELAYRLYIVCERKKRAAEALAYNGLVQSWTEITRLASDAAAAARPAQSEMPV